MAKGSGLAKAKESGLSVRGLIHTRIEPTDVSLARTAAS